MAFGNCCTKVGMLQSEYLSWEVNVLTTCPKISDLTKAYFFELNLSHLHGGTG